MISVIVNPLWVLLKVISVIKLETFQNLADDVYVGCDALKMIGYHNDLF